MTKDEALKLALEALEESHPEAYRHTITAIKEALAQPEQLISDQINYGMSVTQGGKRIDPMSIYKEPEQAPVAWDGDCVLGHCGFPAGCEASNCCRANYTTPPQRKPLTDLQIGQILDDPNIAEAHQGHWRVLPFAYARAIEAAHGIKGEA